MRKSLTYHKLPVKRTIILSVIAMAGFIYLKLAPDSKDNVINVPVMPLLLFLFGSLGTVMSIGNLLFIRFQKRRIEFDEHNMYLLRNGAESIIPLKNISSVKMTGIFARGMYWWNEYKIMFADNFNEVVYITFWNRSYKGELTEFQNNVRNENPSVEIKNWATNFDPIIDLFRQRK